MSRRRGPEGVEIELLDDGSAPSEGEGVTRATPWWTWIAVAVAAVAVLLLVAERRSGSDDDPPPHRPESSGLGIFELDEIRLADATTRDDVTYPLFDRRWDQHLVLLQQDNLVALDLDTGEARVLADLSDAIVTTRLFRDAQLVDDGLHLVDGGGGLLRVDTDGTELLVESPSQELPVPAALLGRWFVEARLADDPAGPTAPEAYLARTPGGNPDVEIEIAHADRVSGLGDHLVLGRAGTLTEIDTEGERREWGRGEIVLGGARTLVWRECDIARCLTWAGRPGDPRAVALDEDTVLSIEGGTPFPAPFTYARAISPDGRMAWRTSHGAPELVDLADGSATAIVGLADAPTISPDATAAASTSGAIPSVFDLTTGEVARIRVPSELGAVRGNAIEFVPSDSPLLAG